MEKVINFIVENYQLLLIVLQALLEVVIFLTVLIKKKDNPALDMVLRELPNLISKAELKFGAGSGETKLGYVVMVASQLYEKLTGLALQGDCAIVKKIKQCVEDILKTPQKKG